MHHNIVLSLPFLCSRCPMRSAISHTVLHKSKEQSMFFKTNQKNGKNQKTYYLSDGLLPRQKETTAYPNLLHQPTEYPALTESTSRAMTIKKCSNEWSSCGPRW